MRRRDVGKLSFAVAPRGAERRVLRCNKRKNAGRPGRPVGGRGEGLTPDEMRSVKAAISVDTDLV